MDDNLNKQLATLAQEHIRAEAGKVRAECGDCDGTGKNRKETSCMAEDDKKLCNTFAYYGCMRANKPCVNLRDCPSCTPDHERLMKLVDKYCWHKVIDTWYRSGQIRGGKCSCGDGLMSKFTVECHLRDNNPTFTTIESLITLLNEMGVREEFAKWHFEQVDPNGDSIVFSGDAIYGYDNCHPSYNFSVAIITHANIKILTTPELLQQAVINFLEVNKNP